MSPPARPRPLVLHVEDSERARYARRRELEGAGYAVIEAANVEQATSLLHERVPDIVISDVRLPDDDGFRFTQAIKAAPATAHIPVILVSAFFTQPSYRITGLDVGADAYLIDPLAPGELAASVRAALRRRDLERDRLEAGRVLAVLEAAVRELPGSLLSVLDRDLRFVFAAGRGFVEMGIDPATLIGRTVGEAFGTDRAQQVAPYYERAFAGESVIYERQIGAHTYQVNAGPVHDGPIERIIVLATDITLHKTAEDMLRALDRRKDAFVATLAHEIRQPLASMDTAVALLHRSAAPDTTQRALRVLDRQVAVLRRLVDDVVDAARIAQGKVELRLEPMDLRAVVDDVAQQAAPAAADQQVRFEIELPPDPVVINGDRDRLQQVLSNLVTNALKHTVAPGEVRTRLEVSASEARLIVADTGTGIAPELLPHVFELFVQGAASPDGGLGIGLAVVRGLIDRHGGRIAVESSAGRGTTFMVTLPLATRPDRL